MGPSTYHLIHLEIFESFKINCTNKPRQGIFCRVLLMSGSIWESAVFKWLWAWIYGPRILTKIVTQYISTSLFWILFFAWSKIISSEKEILTFTFFFSGKNTPCGEMMLWLWFFQLIKLDLQWNKNIKGIWFFINQLTTVSNFVSASCFHFGLGHSPQQLSFNSSNNYLQIYHSYVLACCSWKETVNFMTDTDFLVLPAADSSSQRRAQEQPQLGTRSHMPWS